jgi:hemoglobin
MQSLYERLGSDEAIQSVVDGFYERVMADPTLAPFFAHTTMSRQRRHLASFVAAATGGPAYHGRSMRAAHQYLGIEQRDFDAVAKHLVAELGSHGVGSDPIAEVVAAIAPLADEIVTDSCVATSGGRRRSPSAIPHQDRPS